MPASIAEVILETAQILRRSGVPDARREASSLLAHALGRDRTFIISHAEDTISEEVLLSFRSLSQRRAQGEPLQYITGHQEFFRLDFEVSSDVLIPRPETELLVETALDLMSEVKAPLICDVGTGSGCIAISLVHEHPTAVALAVDLSQQALRIAKRNSIKHAVADRIDLVVSDCFDAIVIKPLFDLVVSNPPYVREDAMVGLQREVRDYEPRVALTPGGDGLAVIRRLILESGPVLKAGGYLLIEIGFDQRELVMPLIDRGVWRLLDIYKDLQGIPRTLTLQKLPIG
jgi:release factor glutamine methyltransferase